MDFQKKKTMPRYFIVTVVFALAALAAVAKSIYIMTAERDYWMEMKGLLIKEGRNLPAKRGKILAADGQILAASLPEYKMYIDFKSSEKNEKLRKKDQARRDTVFTNNLDSICRGLHRIFPDMDTVKLKAHLKEGFEKKSQSWPVYVEKVVKKGTTPKFKYNENRQISYVEYSQVKELPLFNLTSSLRYDLVDMRRRPFDQLAIRTVGDFKDTARYGLEVTFDTLLAGKPGTFHYEKVMEKRVKVIDRPAEDGYDIRTTLDVSMQEFCERALRERLIELDSLYAENCAFGICILMEVKTGDVKAMVSLSRQKNGTYAEERAMAVTDLYSPGSVFKPQSFLVAFRDGKFSKDDMVDTKNGNYRFGTYTMRDASGNGGEISAAEAIQKSSNVGVSRLIYDAYKDDQRSYVQGLYDIGSAEDLRFPLPGYEKPRIRFPGQDGTLYWSAITLPLMSIGYETEVTPINTLACYNGIANNGKMVRPRLVTALMRDGNVEKEYPIEILREQMAPPQAITEVQECLGLVTRLGTGKQASSPLFPCAGKTGTAQVWTGHGKTKEYFVTFAGYFPSDQPQYSCIICIRRPYPAGGGISCAPTFRRISEYIMSGKRLTDYTEAQDTARAKLPIACKGNMQTTAQLLNTLNVPTNIQTDGANVWSGTNQEETIPANAMPDLSGYGLRDAVFRLESMGLKVRTEGVGKVVEQSIPPGADITKGEIITLKLAYDTGKEQSKDKKKKHS